MACSFTTTVSCSLLMMLIAAHTCSAASTPGSPDSKDIVVEGKTLRVVPPVEVPEGHGTGEGPHSPGTVARAQKGGCPFFSRSRPEAEEEEKPVASAVPEAQEEEKQEQKPKEENVEVVKAEVEQWEVKEEPAPLTADEPTSTTIAQQEEQQPDSSATEAAAPKEGEPAKKKCGCCGHGKPKQEEGEEEPPQSTTTTEAACEPEPESKTTVAAETTQA